MEHGRVRDLGRHAFDDGSLDRHADEPPLGFRAVDLLHPRAP